MRIGTRSLAILITLSPIFAQSTRNSINASYAVCTGNEDKTLSYGCTKQPEPLTIQYCKTYCQCDVGNKLECPEYVTCFDERINSTEPCVIPVHLVVYLFGLT